MDFEKVCTIFTMQEPYYGILLSAMDRFPTTKIDTMGVCRSGNVFRLGYNPDYVADKDLPTLLCCLKHEAIHVAFNVFTMFSTEPSCPAEQQLRNMAADMEANSYIDWSQARGVSPVFARDFGWDNCLGTIEYFNRLNQTNQQQQQQQQKANAKNPQQPCNGGRGGQGGSRSRNNNQQNQQGPQRNQQNQNNCPDDEEGDEIDNPQPQNQQNDMQLSPQMQQEADKSFDDHSMWPKDMTEEQMEDLKQAIDDLCDFAAEEVEKGCGNVPGEMVGRIKLIRDKKKPKPVADWKKYFRRYIGNEFSDQIKKSRKRESMRFPDAAGNRHKRKSHILVAIDTSGSVSMPEYREFFGQLKTMKDVTFHVVECDAEIQFEYDFNGTIRETLHGGGGTSFYPPIKMYLDNRRKYEGIVYFTDGECDIPSITPKETLWVISSRGDHNRQKYKRNGASVVFIPPKNADSSI